LSRYTLGSRTEKPNPPVFFDDDEAVGHGVEDDVELRLNVLQGDGFDRLTLSFPECQQN
jgi:hypothetical protein